MLKKITWIKTEVNFRVLEDCFINLSVELIEEVHTMTFSDFCERKFSLANTFIALASAFDLSNLLHWEAT